MLHNGLLAARYFVFGSSMFTSKICTFFFVALLMFSLQLSASELKVAVAANFHHTLEALAENFKKVHPDTDIEIISGASSSLASDILAGKLDVDLFLSASKEAPKRLEKESTVIEGSRKTYAYGKLAFWHQEKDAVSPEQIDAYLANNNHTVAIADPETAPYGNRAVEVLKSFNLYQRLSDQNRIQEEDHVHDAWESVKGGNATVGFVALSLLEGLSDEVHSHISSDVGFTAVPSNLYSPLEQQLVILRDTKEQTLSEAFSDFLLSDESQNLIANHGYDSVSDTKRHSPKSHQSLGTDEITGIVAVSVLVFMAAVAVSASYIRVRLFGESNPYAEL